MDNETLLFDRLEMIKTTINKYGEENFYISFSGGKDSTVLHYLVDMALPNNKIPRVFSNTGIEYQKIVEFVKSLAKEDDRFEIITPNKNIKKTLEDVGYPFKSKIHSHWLSIYQNSRNTKGVRKYIGIDEGNIIFKCPNSLKYQFTENFNIKVSEKCCNEMKKKPFKQWSKKNNKVIAITGMRKEEGGARKKLDCVVTKNNEVIKFHPLVVVSEEWEDWFIEKFNIKLCELYYPPYNFQRTGCMGCPFSLSLQKQLDVMEELLPNEKKQCELIWKPVYDEYRRLGYRLRKEEQDG